jgi:hypothetical protein
MRLIACLRVIPAEAGTSGRIWHLSFDEVPAFAGMTGLAS